MKEKKIKVLQLGKRSWSSDLISKDYSVLDWTSINVNEAGKGDVSEILEKYSRPFDVVVCTDKINNKALRELSDLIEAYGLIVDRKLQSKVDNDVKKKKQPFFLNFEDRRGIIEEIKKNFFSGQMGSKLHTNNIKVTSHFKGRTVFSGESHLLLEGNFSKLGRIPLLTWQQNIGLYGRSKKLWLEFESDSTVNFSLTLLKIREGGSEVVESVTYNQNEVRRGIEVAYENNIGYLSVHLTVNGHGKLKVGPLHFRDSRQGYGEYILGGKKIFDESNQELFYYFHPGDLKPPLNVYFSGYRSAEGFEGFFMMKALGTPFLLITDPRLEGGSFYMGSASLEEKLVEIIQTHLKLLNFGSEELILSGLSMGTYGALYYANQLEPGHVIVGKPLVNVGTIAQNEKLIRPGGFPTSLDILNSLTGSLMPDGVEALNQRFWKKFDQGNFETTRFIIAYMMHDDYDVHAYQDLIQHLSNRRSSVISKGIPGRHNDNSQGINEWFINQYKRVLLERFNRTKKVKI